MSINEVHDYSGLTPYVPRVAGPYVVMVDLDGTLCLHNGRSPYDESRVGEDQPNLPVRAAVYALHHAGHKVLFLSGRGHSGTQVREDTEKWLAEHYALPYEGLFMRQPGDRRKDWVVKSELFDEHVAPFYRVLCVFDDRKQVVDMWRHRGLTVFQVAEGRF